MEQLHYVHGLTSKEEWDSQIKKVINNEISAPMLSVNSNFFTFNLQLYGDKNSKGLGRSKNINI